MSNLLIDERLSTLEKKVDALTNLIDQQIQRAPNYFNYKGGHYFQPRHIMPSYFHSGWRTYEDFPYRSQNFESQEAQVTIIKNKSSNLMMKKCFMPYGMR